MLVADSSFDVVSKVDRQEVDNALNQAAKEIGTRFDFKNVGASIAWSGEKIEMVASSEDRVKAVLDVFKDKLVKRGISLKALDAGEPRLSGKDHHITASLQAGLSQENAKKLAKIIRDEGPKNVTRPDPGRRAPGQREEEGRPAGRDRAAEGSGPRLRDPVHQLPLTVDNRSAGVSVQAT